MAEFKKVASKADIPAGNCKTVESDGTSVAVFNVEGKFHAVDNTCVHQA